MDKDKTYFHLAAGQDSSLVEASELFSLKEMQKLYIQYVVELHGGDIPTAAKVLDVSPSTLYRKMKKWTDD